MTRPLRFMATIAFCAAFGSVVAQSDDMTFFLTSKSPGDGANLGGLAGADAHCQKLANSVGSGGKTFV